MNKPIVLLVFLLNSVYAEDLPVVEQQTPVQLTIQTNPTVPDYGYGYNGSSFGSYPGGGINGNFGYVPTSNGNNGAWGGIGMNPVPGFNPGGGMLPPGMMNEVKGCPFTAQDEDVNKLWASTRDALNNIANQNKNPNCMLVRSNAATLQSALQQFERERNRALGGTSLASSPYGSQFSGVISPTCENYKDVYRNEYHQMLQLISRNYELHSMPGDYHGECIDVYPADVENNGYTQEFRNCLGDTLAKKMELAAIECGVKGDYIDEIERDEASFKAKQEALVTLNAALGELTQNIGKCDDKGMVQAALRSVVNVGSMIAAPEIGGVNGVWAAFGGNVLDNLIQYIFAKDSQQALADMDNEDEYNRLACLFFNSQKMRCDNSSNTGMGGGIFGPTLPCKDIDPETEKAQDFLKNLTNILRIYSGNQKYGVFEDLLKSELSQGESTRDFLTKDVKQALVADSSFEELGKLNKFMTNYDELMKTIKGISEDPDSFNDQTLAKMNDLKGKIDFNSLKEVLQKYMVIKASEKTGFDTNVSIEMAQQIAKQFEEASKSALYQWNNQRKMGQITTVLVSNLKDKFEDKIESHFKSDLKTALGWMKGSKDDPRNREKAFNSISGILNDCILTEGMYAMEKSRIDGKALSTTQISEDSTYKKYCQAFKCNYGLPEANYDEITPQSFLDHQCNQIMSYPYIVSGLRSEFMATGKICGKSLKEIYKEGK